MKKHFVHLRFLQKVICFVAASMVVVASGNAAIINLTGTVTDSATQKPIEGAKVKLALIPSCTTRTDVSGSYTLSGATTGALMQPLGNQSISAPFFRNSTLFFSIANDGLRVRIALYTLLGRCMSTLVDEQLGHGGYHVDVQTSGLAGGIFLVKLEIGSAPPVVFELPCMNGRSAVLASVQENARGSSLACGLGKTTVVTVDTILVTASGYQAGRLAITSYTGVNNFALPPSPAKDTDGNIYHTVVIGTQVWMVENLKTTRLNDGSVIPLVTNNAAWTALTMPGYCWNNNDSANKTAYGALYNWYTVNTGKLAPAGWHVPTDAEWTTLATYLGGVSVAGGKLKEAGLAHWQTPNTGATNETGFLALPGGYRPTSGAFYSIGTFAPWWSSTANDATSSWFHYVYYQGADMVRKIDNKTYGYSVRCLRNP